MADDIQQILANMQRILRTGLTEEETRELEDMQVAAASSGPVGPAAASSAPAPLTGPGAPDVDKSRTAPGTKYLEQVSFSAPDAVKQYEDDAAHMVVDAEHFQPIAPTTFGLSGKLSGVLMNESDIMQYVRGNFSYPCLGIWSNYGTEKLPNFDEIIKERGISLASSEKSQRNREKKIERTGGHARKVQGNGTCFYSSVLFWIYSESFKIVYKFLLFRNGKINLPGTKPEMLHDIIHLCNSALIPSLHCIFAARAAGTGQMYAPDCEIRLVMLASVMKNYKWRRLMPPGCTLMLRQLADKMKSGQVAQPFKIKYAHFKYGESKLPVKFVTPIRERSDKMVRVNIFLSGKINILGAHNSDTTKKICEYLAAVLTDDIIQPPQSTQSVDVDAIDRAAADPDDDLPYTDEIL